jgi:hypothetical protein
MEETPRMAMASGLPDVEKGWVIGTFSSRGAGQCPSRTVGDKGASEARS